MFAAAVEFLKNYAGLGMWPGGRALSGCEQNPGFHPQHQNNSNNKVVWGALNLFF